MAMQQRIRTLWRNNRAFLLLVGLMFVFRSAVADWNHVPSSSMNPTLIYGDRIMVNKLAYSLRVPFTLRQVVRWGTPSRGDVITFDSPKDDVNLIKRVVAVGGDVVRMHDNVLTINGQQVPRTLVDASRVIPSELGPLDAEVWQEQLDGKRFDVARLPSFNRLRDFDPVTVPEGKVMVLGDSRDNSNDSRFIGFVDVNRITGRAWRVAFSLDYDNYYLPRAGRWWQPLHS
jgi:signal peptidase I